MSFAVGQKVCKKADPKTTGTVLSDPIAGTKRIRQKIRWDNGGIQDALVDSLKAFDENIPKTVMDFIREFQYGSAEDLRLLITRQRLSGQQENMIYSLNLTNTEFFPYQFKPLITFLNSRSSSLLIADEVGLGKTIEAGLIWTELQMREQARHLLVICPATLCKKWKDELRSKFNVEAEILNAHELYEAVYTIRQKPAREYAFIVSLQGCRPPKNWDDEDNTRGAAMLARELHMTADGDSLFDLAILDEAHSIRNSETQSYEFVKLIRPLCDSFLMLSATPIQTSSENLFTLVHLLDPDYFPHSWILDRSIKENVGVVRLCDMVARNPITQKQFLDQLEEIEAKGLRQEELDLLKRCPPTDEELKNEEYRIRLVNRLSLINPLSQIMTRTLKRSVQINRVVREPFVHVVQMTEAEQRFYRTITEEIISYCYSTDTPVGFATVMPQRRISSSPQATLLSYLEDGYDEDADFNEELKFTSDDEDEIQDSSIGQRIRRVIQNFPQKKELLAEDSKFNALLEALNKYWVDYPGKKIIVFSFFKKTLRRLKDQLAEHNITALVYDGDLDESERFEKIEKFKVDDTQVLLSSEIAAEGIDLQFMNCLFNYDLPWNPAKIEQRIGRIDRIGQKEPIIHIHNFVHAGTIDDRIYRLLLERLNIFKEALGVAEEVLGAELKSLTQKLFSRKLTPEQQDAVIEQSRMAVARCAAEQKNAEGQSMVFDTIQKQVETAQTLERYITDSDLVTYIQAFCRRVNDNSQLVTINSDEHIYRLVLTPRIKAEFGDYLSNFEPGRGSLLPQPASEGNVRIRNKQEKERTGIERITQNHPFVRFISFWYARKHIQPHPLIAAKVLYEDIDRNRAPSISPGIYFFYINCWKSKGIGRDKFELAYRMIRMDTQEEIPPIEAEYLVNITSYLGEDWNSLSVKANTNADNIEEAYGSLEDRLEEEFSQYRLEQQQSNDADAAYQIHQFESELLRLVKQYENDSLRIRYLTRALGQKGRLTALTNKFNKRQEAIKEKIERIKYKQQQFSVTSSQICLGLINVK